MITKSTLYKTYCIAGLIICAGYVLSRQGQPKAGPILAVSQLGISVANNPSNKNWKRPMPPIIKVDNIVADAAPYADSIRRRQKQDESAKKTPANLYLQIQTNERLTQTNLDLKQVLSDQSKALIRLQSLLDRRADTVFLTPVVIQTDTIYKGLIPIMPGTNKERKEIEKTKQGIEKLFRDSLRPGGSSQTIIGYRIS